MRFLDQFALTPLFQSIVCMEDAPAKPNPQPVALALQQMGVERAWMIGDTPDDIRAARAAGVLPLGVVAPGDNTTQTAQVLLRSGAACVLESAQRVEDFLP